MKRILIDGRFVGVGESMTRYTLEILRGILALDSGDEYTLLIRPAGVKITKEYLRVDASLKEAGQLKIEVLDIPHYSLPEQTKLLNYLNRQKFDLVHFIQFNHPILYKKPFVVTVHDLTMVGYLHRSNPVKRAAFGKVMKSAVKDSKKVITISEFSKKEIIDYYRTDPDKIKVVYNGLNHESYNNGIKNQKSRIKKFKEKQKVGGSYLLYTGAWKKHKNLIRLLKAFEQVLKLRVEKDQLQLVLAGKMDDNEPEVMTEIERINKSLNTKYHIPNAIIVTGYIDEDDLPLAYAGALAYVMPSLNEGFGLPPLEAMACSTPVISSNVSCMPEILGDAAYYFDPLDINEIAKAIEMIVSDKELRSELIKKGLKQAAKYSWNKTAKETLAVYKSLL